MTLTTSKTYEALELAMVDWYNLAADTTDIDELVNHLESIAIRAARLSRYLQTCHGTWGEAAHQRAVKDQNRVAKQVRKALGYSYPEDTITF